MADESPRRRELLVSKTWVQASIVVFLLGFFVLGLLAYRTYSADPPIPERVVDPESQTLFTGEDITRGQKARPDAAMGIPRRPPWRTLGAQEEVG
jgi:nitric oxide reductase subunit B